jgi:hypothetical protein
MNKKIVLKSFKIKELMNKWDKSYYLIINGENDSDVYYCFENKLDKDSWQILTQIPQPKEIEIEYVENNQKGKIYKHTTFLINLGNVFI